MPASSLHVSWRSWRNHRGRSKVQSDAINSNLPVEELLLLVLLLLLLLVLLLFLLLLLLLLVLLNAAALTTTRRQMKGSASLQTCKTIRPRYLTLPSHFSFLNGIRTPSWESSVWRKNQLTSIRSVIFVASILL